MVSNEKILYKHTIFDITNERESELIVERVTLVFDAGKGTMVVFAEGNKRGGSIVVLFKKLTGFWEVVT